MRCEYYNTELQTRIKTKSIEQGGEKMIESILISVTGKASDL